MLQFSCCSVRAPPILTVQCEQHILRANVSESTETTDARREAGPIPGAAYLSAVLIALALMLLVFVARPRVADAPRQAVAPTGVSANREQSFTGDSGTRTLLPTREPKPTQMSAPMPTAAAVTVYVTGEVRRPGVYTIPLGSRVGDAVRLAGGLTRRADRIALNLALRLRDEMQITVPRAPDPRATPQPRAALKREQPPIVEPTAGASGPIKAPSPTERTSTAPDPGGVVNINTATQGELETLPGIGPTKAQAIIEYRREKGPFQTPDELQEVTGIGPKTWEGLKDRVRT